MENINLGEILNSLFFIYACVLFCMYILTALLSISEMDRYLTKNRYTDYKGMLSYKDLPSVSVIAPAYNEELTIIENVNCLLGLKYKNFEIIIVNDGSKDKTLELVINYFHLVKVNRAYNLTIDCNEIRGIYQSVNSAYYNLVVVDKVNGGKADALNAGINVSQNDLFLALDVDCILEPYAILKMVKPFVDDAKNIVIASGGVVRIANSCIIENERVAKVNFPTNIWRNFKYSSILEPLRLAEWHGVSSIVYL